MVSLKYAADDDTFIRLVQIARDDPKINKEILKILTLDSFNRQSALNTLLDTMRLKGAPLEFIEAVDFLVDDDVAEKFLVVINAGG